MTATRLQLILSVVMILIVVATSAGFWFIQRNLREYASAISVLNANANSGDQNLKTLNGLQARLDAERMAIDGAHALVADQATYADQVIADLTRIAAAAGVRITSFEFVEDVAAPTAPAAGTTATLPAAGATPISPAAPAGVVKKTVSVSIESPLSYSELMKFLSGIETNPLKMQIPSVTMTKGENTDVTTQQFSIEVYVRQ